MLGQSPAYAQLQRDVEIQRWRHVEKVLGVWGTEKGTAIINARFGTTFSTGAIIAIADRYYSVRAARAVARG